METSSSIIPTSFSPMELEDDIVRTNGTGRNFNGREIICSNTDSEGASTSGRTWLKNIYMTILGSHAQPYQRLDTDHATSAAEEEEHRGLLGGDASRDDGAQFSMLRFLQFCGSG